MNRASPAFEYRHDLTRYARSARDSVVNALCGAADRVDEPAPGVFEGRGLAWHTGGRVRACRVAPGLTLLAADYERIVSSRVIYRGDDVLYLTLRLDGDFDARHLEPGVHSRATAVYMPPGTEHDIRVKHASSWRTLTLIGTPRSFDRAWRLGQPLLDALGVSPDGRRSGAPVVFRPWRVTRELLEIRQSIDAPHMPAAALHAFCSARAQQLACEFLAGGPTTSTKREPHERARAGARQAQLAILADPAAAHTLESLARTVGLNRRLLAEGFRAEFGETMFDCLSHARLRRAFDLLNARPQKVAAIAAAVGYSDPASFARAFKSRFGITPTQATRGAQAAHPRA